MTNQIDSFFAHLTNALATRAQADDILTESAQLICQTFSVEGCEIALSCNQRFYRARSFLSEESRVSFLELEVQRGGVCLDGERLPLPLFFTQEEAGVFQQDLEVVLRTRSIRSLGIVGLSLGGHCLGWIQCVSSTPRLSWEQSTIISLLALAEKITVLFKEALQSLEVVTHDISADLSKLPVPVIFASLDGSFLGANKRAFEDLRLDSKTPELRRLLRSFMVSSQVEKVLSTLTQLGEAESSFRCYDIEGGVRLNDGQFKEVTLYVTRLDHATSQCILLFLPGKRVSLQGELLDIKLQYRRLIDYTGAVVVRTDTRLFVTSLSGDLQRILGISAESVLLKSLVSNSPLQAIIPIENRSKLLRQFRRYVSLRVPIQDEFVSSLPSGNGSKWLSIVAVPLYGSSAHRDLSSNLDTDSTFLGWEIIFKDVTDARRIQLEKDAQERRLSALYEVAKALEFNSEASEVTQRGLEALIKATNSRSGYVAFFDRATRHLRLATSSGLQKEFVQAIDRRIQNDPSLTRNVVESGNGLIVSDLLDDYRVDRNLVIQQGVRSALMVPLVYEDNPLGVLAVFSEKPGFFSQADFNLAAISASQICLAARRAEFYMAEKRQANSLAALYRLSHELSKYHTPRDIAHHSFSVIQDELACKRMWLGILDETGTHVLGQSGVGPGLRRSLQTLQVELNDRNRFLKEAFELKQPIIVEAGTEIGCASLARIMRKLDVGTFIIVPLIALGEDIGVLVVEPLSTSTFFSQKKLPLLSSMASEIATVILARRFESRVAATEKMRMAGLLASGVAHNFNNLLQAVLGQASLLEMQLPKGSPLIDSARVIMDAANRGASLINQLLGLSLSGNEPRHAIDAVALLRRSEELYRALLGDKISLHLSIQKQHLPVSLDERIVQQVLTSLLMNARDAVEGQEWAEILVVADKVEVHPGDVKTGLMPGEYVSIEFADNGRGMPPEETARCFEPFFSTKQSDGQAGMSVSEDGLGLSSAYSIIQQNQGSLTVRSVPGDGTTFTVLLPLVPSNVLEFAQPGVTRRQGAQVVLIDFTESEAAEISARFETLGIVVRSETTWEEACEYLTSASQMPRVVMLDADDNQDEIIDRLHWLTHQADFPRVLVACNQDFDRERLLEQMPVGVEIVQKPLGVWKMHQIAKSAFSPSDNDRGARLRIVSSPASLGR
jgi:signal transduction histidine kinase/putative methionine-R-sulfoxide reductase with GAF domain/PAS domain-containing protein